MYVIFSSSWHPLLGHWELWHHERDLTSTSSAAPASLCALLCSCSLHAADSAPSQILFSAILLHGAWASSISYCPGSFACFIFTLEKRKVRSLPHSGHSPHTDHTASPLYHPHSRSHGTKNSDLHVRNHTDRGEDVVSTGHVWKAKSPKTCPQFLPVCVSATYFTWHMEIYIIF